MCELFRAFASRGASRVYWQTQPLRNLRLAAVVTLSAGLQVAIHNVEPVRHWVHPSGAKWVPKHHRLRLVSATTIGSIHATRKAI